MKPHESAQTTHSLHYTAAAPDADIERAGPFVASGLTGRTWASDGCTEHVASVRASSACSESGFDCLGALLIPNQVKTRAARREGRVLF